MTVVAAAAERTFRARQAFAARMVGEGRWPRAEAEAKLRPWLAIAAMAGADLPELVVEGEIVFPWAQAGSPCRLRRSASELCPPQGALAELARARDAALDALPDGAAGAPQATADLVALAIHLRAPPYRYQRRPAEGRKVAA